MVRRIAASLVLAGALGAIAQIEVTGTVTGKGGAPLANAIVLLIGQDTMVATDAQGHYRIYMAGMGVKQMSVPASSMLKIHNGKIAFSVPMPTYIEIGVFDARGVLVSPSVKGVLSAGRHSFALSENALGHKVLFVRTIIGTTVYTCKYLLSSDAVVGLLGRSSTGSTLAKTAALVDTVKASAAGYISKSTPISAYVAVVDFALDTIPAGTATNPSQDGSAERIALYGKTQYYWGDMLGNGVSIPLVMVTAAVSPTAVDAVLVFNPAFVDNTYGVNSIGWNPHRFGVGHTFRDLYISDHVELSFMNCAGQEVWHGSLDYLSSTTTVASGYACLGPDGGDGSITVGSASDVLSYGSSLDDNINYYGYRLFVDSPQTDSIYTPNSNYPYWEYRVIYRIAVDPAIFGPSGYCGVFMTYVHASPSKNLSTVSVVEGPTPPPTTGYNPWVYPNPNIPGQPGTPVTPPIDTLPPGDTIPPDTLPPG